MNSGPGTACAIPVSGDELVAGDPSRRDHFRLQQRQHDVAAAEHQRSGAVEPVEHAQPVAVRKAAGDRSPASSRTKADRPTTVLSAPRAAVRGGAPAGVAGASLSSSTPAAAAAAIASTWVSGYARTACRWP